MIERYFDEAFIRHKGQEFSLDELEDLYDWFEAESPAIEDLSEREMAAWEIWTREGDEL